ncbi:MAG: acetoin utilization protein AcuC [Gammaproteobacteria bacterium]|nr:acetoin utilization protein AcuC [Gammaproteobacteria bacterium]
MELCELLGWLDETSFRPAPAASVDRLATFHDRDYIEELRAADQAGNVDRAVREHRNFGNLENPLFPGVFERAATAVGGSILAAELALEGRAVFHPAGGTHHGRRDRASGFCYFNDPVFAILALLQRGCSRVLYVDVDAHHCDGVQDAFDGDPRVLMVSIHESGRWPHTGAVGDRGAGSALNLPVPAGLNDSEFRCLVEEVVLPAGAAFAPDAVVITCGTDALAGDPLSRLALSNVALWDAVTAVGGLAVPAVVLGGGGYNPWTLARCWTGLWGRLAGRDIPGTLPTAARQLLAGLECDLVDEDDRRPEWFSTLADEPNSGPVRAAVRDLVATHDRGTNA